MDIADLIVFFTKNFDSINSFIKTLGYIFFLGFGIFLIFYLKTLREHLKNWREMDSFDKIVFIFIIGLIIIIPIIFYSLVIFLIGMIIYEIFAPYVCGRMMDYFALIFFATTLYFFFYVASKFKIKKLDLKSLILLLSLWKHIKYLLLTFVVLLILVLVFGILRNCIFLI